MAFDHLRTILSIVFVVLTALILFYLLIIANSVWSGTVVSIAIISLLIILLNIERASRYILKLEQLYNGIFIIVFTSLNSASEILTNRGMSFYDDIQKRRYEKDIKNIVLDVEKSDLGQLDEYLFVDFEKIELVWKNESKPLGKRDEIIIVLDETKSEEKIMADFIFQFVDHTLLPHQRWYLDKHVNIALTTIISEIIVDEFDIDINQNIINELMKQRVTESNGNQEQAKSAYESFKKVADTGLLGSVLLAEYSKFPSSNINEAKIIKSESIRLLDMLANVSEKDLEKSSNIDDKSPFLAESFAEGGLSDIVIFYIKEYIGDQDLIEFRKALANFDTIYILAKGKYIKIGENIVDEIKDLRGVTEYRMRSFNLNSGTDTNIMFSARIESIDNR